MNPDLKEDEPLAVSSFDNQAMGAGMEIYKVRNLRS